VLTQWNGTDESHTAALVADYCLLPVNVDTAE